MHIHIVTLFPEFFSAPLQCGLMQKAVEAGIVSFTFHNPRDFATDKHRSVDDRPYGGGPGMVMMPGPVHTLLCSLGYGPRGSRQPGRLILLTPGGKVFTQTVAAALAQYGNAASADTAEHPLPFPAGSLEHSPFLSPVFSGQHSPDGREPHTRDNAPMLTLICGRYEGLDARIEDFFPVESYSVGDFVLNGGEAGALCVIEAVSRLLPGFMGHEDSGDEESFSAGLLEYPHYTRPEEFESIRVPGDLLTGDHARIARWRKKASLARTLAFRPDLLEHAPLDTSDRAFLRNFQLERPGRNLYCALIHYPVLDKAQKSVAVSLTNLDIHDIARSSCAYGLGGYYVVTPLKDQQELLENILAHWTEGPGKQSNPDRDKALRLVRGKTSVEEAIADVKERSGHPPLVVSSSAGTSVDSLPCLPYRRIADMLYERPVLLLLGTGQGLSPELHSLCDGYAPPLRWHGSYNHLSVRSALAIMLDRILGDLR